MSKRENYITWDEYFMSVAILSSFRSKDPSTQVGCCIVDERKRIVSLGYNGFPEGVSDDEFPWDREAENPLDTKYLYVVHAELNAILNARLPLSNCTLYTSLFPCNECAKAIIQSGIKEVKYLENKYSDTSSVKASYKMMEKAGIKMVKIDEPRVKITM